MNIFGLESVCVCMFYCDESGIISLGAEVCDYSGHIVAGNNVNDEGD